VVERATVATSSEKEVLSGIPQGTVLGPLSFLLYKNDIDENINSCICLFADNCVLYGVIKSPEDHCTLQQDLLKEINIWLMKLNVDK